MMKYRFYVAGGATIFSTCYTNFINKCNVRCMPLKLQQSKLLHQVAEWSNRWFDGTFPSPGFPICGQNVKVLSTPHDFYNELMKRASLAKQRITLASLYLGNGEMEEKLVAVIHDNARQTQHPPAINILLEYTRGSRGLKNSRTMLMPLLKDFQHHTSVALFHTPNLRGILKTIVPQRFDETINVAHLKIYLFDDTLIISGANLSEDYFTNRQDRYIVFENCPSLCDYYEELVKTISKFCFQLQPDDTVKLHDDFHHHPFSASKETFNKAANSLLVDFIDKYSSISQRTNFLEKLNISTKHHIDRIKGDSLDKASVSDGLDTMVFPLLQMRTMGINQDEIVTENILKFSPKNTDLVLATAYFNVTDSYWNAMISSEPNIKIIMAHPKAMGFYNAAGLAGGIPNAYSYISKLRFKDLLKLEETGRITFLEFYRENWTFHGKGLWASFKKEGHLDDTEVVLTMVGSPNFGKRSVYRDMESQVAIVTTNESLKKDLLVEQENMKCFTSKVNLETFNEDGRQLKWWVFLIANIMNDMF